MEVTINTNVATLEDLGITLEQFEQAASSALSNLSHPDSGEPLYFNNVRVTAIADTPEIHADTSDLGQAANLLSQHTVTFASTRAGMGDYWTETAERLRDELVAEGLSPDTPDDVIHARAGGWFVEMGENTKASIIATMRKLAAS